VNELALFAGAGGGLLASRLLGWRTVCAVEIDDYCQRVLLQRQRDGMLDCFPIWDDCRSFDGTEWCGRIDVVTAGFPCQPFSTAGKQLGEDDPRNCWPDTARILGEIRPRWALLENVPALLTRAYFGRILSDLAGVGFDVRWKVFSASQVGAPQLRSRLFFLANANSERWPAIVGPYIGAFGTRLSEEDWTRRPWSNECEYRRGLSGRVRPFPSSFDVGMANGVASRVDRLRAVGNGQVPAVAVRAWRELSREFMSE